MSVEAGRIRRGWSRVDRGCVGFRKGRFGEGDSLSSSVSWVLNRRRQLQTSEVGRMKSNYMAKGH